MSEYGGFTLKRTHAPGAITSVHEATAADGRPGRFALKIFHPEPSSKVRRLLAIESWLLAAEKQQLVATKGGVVTEIVAFGRCDEGAYVVSPWQERSLEPLAETLAPKGDYLRALADCLLATLEKWETQTGGPHGKLKPSNVFLQGDGALTGRTAQLSDPWSLPGGRVDDLRARDLAAVGAMLAQIVRKRAATGWPIEDAPEWHALGRPGKAWLAFCNFLIDPQADPAKHTLAEARRRLRKIPRDARPVRTAILTTTAIVLLAVGSVAGFARFGDPEIMPRKIRQLAENLGNPRSLNSVIAANWAPLCRAWDTWLPVVLTNADRLQKTSGLWEPQNDPLKKAIADFVANAAKLQPGAVVPEAAGEKRLSVLADSPSPALRRELYKGTVTNDIDAAYAKILALATQLEKWPRWEEMRNLLAVLQENKFSRAADALAPKLPPQVGVGGVKQDVMRTLTLLNDISLDDTGTLLLASRWSDFFAVKTEMEASKDHVQMAIPRLLLSRLTDRSSIGDFADSLESPVEQIHRRRKEFMDPQVVRDRFLKESPLQELDPQKVTESDLPRWEQELAQYSKVPAADDPRRAPDLDATAAQLTAAAVDLEKEAPPPEPGGLPTLAAADFDTAYKQVTGELKTLRAREIVRHDLPEIAAATGKIGTQLQLLEQRLDATLALLRPDVWLKKVAGPFGKFEATRQRWAAWQQAALTGVTAASLEGVPNRPRFRALRQQERTLRDFINGLEGPDGIGALAPPDLTGISADTAGPMKDLEAARREQAVRDVAAAAAWQGVLPAAAWSAQPATVRAPIEAHRKWLAEVPAMAGELDHLGQLLTDGMSWSEGISDVEDQLARHPGLDAIGGKPAEWHAEAKQLGQLVASTDRAALEAAAQSGGLSRKLTAWRRFGSLPGWPTGVKELDFDGAVVAALREIVARDIKDDVRRRVLQAELAKETRVRWNRAAHNSAKNEKDLAEVFNRMDKYGIGESDLDDPVAYNFALWRLKNADWGETDLGRLRVRRDNFVAAARAKAVAAADPGVDTFLKALSDIDLVENSKRPPTPSPRMKGWKEELTDNGLGLIATWTSGGHTVKLEFEIVQPTDDTLPFYLAKREIAVGEFIDLIGERKEGAEVIKELQPWARSGDSYDKPFDRAMSWQPRVDFSGITLNQNDTWIWTPTAPVLGLLDSEDAATGSPAVEKDALSEMIKEKPTLLSPLQQIPPAAARTFVEDLIGARLPTPQEWNSVVKLYGNNAAGNFRGPIFQGLNAFLDKYVVRDVKVPWRPVEGAFKVMYDPPGGGRRQPLPDDGKASTELGQGVLWPTPVDVGPVVDKFQNLFGNVWIFLYDPAAKQYYVAGGSVLSPPGVDYKQPQKVEVSGRIGAKTVTDGYDDVGVRPAFDAPPGFRERYKLILLVAKQSFLTL